MRAAMRALRNVMAELDLTMGLTGVGSIPDLVPGLLTRTDLPPPEGLQLRHPPRQVTCARSWRM